MAHVEANSPVVETLSWLVGRARAIRGKLSIYVALIGEFWAALVVSSKGIEPFLPAPAKGKDWAWYGKAIGIGLGIPTGILLLAEGIPALLQRRRDRNLELWGIQGEASRGYFRLTPYDRQDRDHFRRADGAHDDILAWLRRDGPTILYLSGRSGAGKSSLLNASVLPGLESGGSPWLTLTLRGFGDPVADLAEGLRKPGFIYKNPPRDLPSEILPLLRKLDDRLEKDDRRLLVLIDQFEEFLIFHEREPERQEPLRRLLADLDREPPARIRFLLVLRSDYEGDISRLDLPRLQQDGNWKQVDSFSENQARDFLLGGFQGPSLGSGLIADVVRHASELDETRGKIRPVVLNMIGLALASRSGQAGRVIGPRESQRLMLDHVREGLKDPLARDHAPGILGQMVTPEGRKELPISAEDLARKMGLAVPLIQGCLTRLNLLGFVRPFDSDGQHSAGTQVWEISHDFVARLLSLILPGWKPSIATRARRKLLGPALVVLGIATVLVLTQLERTRAYGRFQSIDRLHRWVGRYSGSSARLLEDGTYEVGLANLGGRAPDLADLLRDDAIARLISRFGLANNALTALPPDLVKLTGLTVLDLGNNKLTALPPDFGRLTGLTSLALNNNELTTLPAELGKLTGLTSLALNNNKLTALPPDFGRLTGLTALNIGANRLGALPPDFGSLTALSELDLSGIGLTALPPDFGKLTGLTLLLVNENKLAELPADFVKLNRLARLELRSNKLTALPPDFVKLTALSELDLSGNELAALPADFGKLTGLTRLALAVIGPSALPPDLGKLTSLKYLDFSGNGLAELPPDLGKLTGLTDLGLGNNKLTVVPPDFGKLTALVNLDLQSNELAALPPEFCRLTGLSTLSLNNNKLTALPPDFGRLTGLTALALNSNRLTALPPDFGRLTGLTTLTLGNNQLTALPPEFCNLTGLSTLTLGNNKLTALPRDFFRLTALTTLEISGNDLKYPPREASLNLQSLFKYLRENPPPGPGTNASATPPEEQGPRP